MKKLSLLAALAAVAIAVPLASGSSHREAPNIALDPAADNTDTYAFVPKDNPGTLAVAANWFPNEVPANGPSFFRFDDKASYYLNIDNTGDGKAEIRYRFNFKTRVRNRASFLYAGPGTRGYSQINHYQTYALTEERRTRRGFRERRIFNRAPVAPSNVGPKTFPNYASLAAQANITKNGLRVFAGQRDDSFFIDLGATFDAINIRKGTGNEGGGKNDLAAVNTQSIVMQIPKSRVTKDRQGVSGPTAANAVVGVWSSTERRRLEVTNSPRITRRSRNNRDVQVSRLGVPLFNELLIPLGQKDRFNRTTPKDDARLYGKFGLSPELAKLLNALFKVNAPENNRTDIVQALLQGIPNLNQHKRSGPAPAVDTLKLNLGIPPAAGAEDRFGVIGGDNAGFPNGRRLGDDVVDIELQVVAGFLKGNKVPLGDGVDRNDKPFSSSFPYLAPPTSGFDSPGVTSPTHPPVPAGG